ncbi:MAG: hypothetical protein PVI98_13800, partial [Burkholderiales bacterium]
MTQRRSYWPVVASAVFAAVFVLLFLYLEEQWEIALLAGGLVVALFASVRFGLLAQVEAAASDHPRTTILVNFAAAVVVILLLRGEHFSLLMLAT